MAECIDELCAELGPLAKHHFNAKWQSSQYSSITNNVPEGCAVITLDFAENDRCEHQDQPQAAYYGYSQVTLHPVVMHYRCPDCSQLMMDSAVFLSDSLDHSAHFVNYVTTRVVEHLKTRINLTSHHFQRRMQRPV